MFVSFFDMNSSECYVFQIRATSKQAGPLARVQGALPCQIHKHIEHSMSATRLGLMRVQREEEKASEVKYSVIRVLSSQSSDERDFLIILGERATVWVMI